MDLGYPVLDFKQKNGNEDQEPAPKKELNGG